MRDLSVADRCWLTTGDVARLLQVTPRGVRWLARAKRLTAERTRSGQWLFRQGDIERVMRQRGRDRMRTRGERLRDVRVQMLKVGLEPRQLSLWRGRGGERARPDAEVKGPRLVRKSA